MNNTWGKKKKAVSKDTIHILVNGSQIFYTIQNWKYNSYIQDMKEAGMICEMFPLKTV